MKATILVTDDTAFIRSSLKSILENAGFESVAEAVDGQDAIDQFCKLKPDIVLLDSDMPRVDGLQAIREICKLDPKASVILCTSAGQGSTIKEAMQIGAKGYLVKPYNSEVVVDRIREILDTDVA